MVTLDASVSARLPGQTGRVWNISTEYITMKNDVMLVEINKKDKSLRKWLTGKVAYDVATSNAIDEVNMLRLKASKRVLVDDDAFGETVGRKRTEYRRYIDQKSW